jgi:hypothetical protein
MKTARKLTARIAGANPPRGLLEILLTPHKHACCNRILQHAQTNHFLFPRRVLDPEGEPFQRTVTRTEA